MTRHRSFHHDWPIAYRLSSVNLNVGPNKYRTKCLVHPANFPSELRGCIAPGLYLHPVKWGVSHSKKALQKIDKYFTEYDKDNGKTSYLTIV